MENTKTIRDLSDAVPLSDDDYLPVNQPNVYNALTQQDGDTRKVKVVKLGDFINKRYATFVIGNVAAGHTKEKVDYLCKGANDHTVINAAITALPDDGGKIVLLEGTYNLGGSILMTKNNVTLQGMGNSTVLNLTVSITSTSSGLLVLTADYCKVADIKFTNNIDKNLIGSICLVGNAHNNIITGNTCSNSTSDTTVCHGIRITGNNVSNNIITGNICSNSNSGDSTCVGIYLSNGASNNIITGNICSNSNSGNGFCCGIYILNSTSINNTVTGNTCSNSNSGTANCYGIYLNTNKNNTVTGNTCSNSNSGTANCYGLSLYAVSNSILTGNICSNSSRDTGGSGGIIINGSSNNVINSNNIKNSKDTDQNNSNTFAFLIMGTSNYNSIHGNNLRFVIENGGAAYTENMTSAAVLPGSATTIGALKTGGSCGFNIV